MYYCVLGEVRGGAWRKKERSKTPNLESEFLGLVSKCEPAMHPFKEHLIY